MPYAIAPDEQKKVPMTMWFSPGFGRSLGLDAACLKRKAAIAADLTGRARPAASYANTCYSLVGQDYGISVAGVYRALDGKLVEVPGAGGVSPMDGAAAFRAAEARYGAAWYAAISADIWGG